MFINDEAQKQILPIMARTSVNQVGEQQQRAGALLQLNPGQQVKAEIISNLPNSLYLARIAGEMYQLEIPLNVQPGETMDLTFVAAEPRIMFQLFRQPESGSSVKLSSMGKWLAAVAGEASPAGVAPETLLENPAAGSQLLASRLKEVITQGGLFYESHLAQWAAGARSLAEILKEPQAKLSRAASGEPVHHGSDQATEAEFADPRALPLIKEQLLLLNSGVLSWKGEAWPGQAMEIAIREHETDDEAAIEASLSLQLPRLGGVEAKLSFSAEGLALELVCDGPDASQALKDGRDELRRALGAAGLHLTGVAVRDGEAG